MSTIQVNFLQQKAALVNAARKYGIPYGVLAGVYGAETSWGNNVATSSTAAVGPFQFEPPTAARYGYPQTNTPTAEQFAAQADAAAHYLSDLFAHTRRWETALRDYSGGGYGLAHVDELDRQLQQGSGHYSGGGISPSAAILGGSLAGAGAIAATGEAAAGTLGAAEAATSAAGDTVGAAESATAGAGAGSALTKGLSDLSSIAKTGGIAALLVDPKFAWRLVKIVGGGLLIMLGLRSLAAAAGAPVSTGRLAGRLA